MPDNSIEMNFDALDTLLEAERAALLDGDLEKLTDMLPQKEALIDALNGVVHTDIPTLQSLDTKVRRNQLLLDGALDGIRNVAQQLAVLRRLKGSLETYGSDGKKHNIDVDMDRSVEKRA
ncbi:MAG: flagellar biosynthesis protein FlgN [Sulfitobacter sp.]